MSELGPRTHIFELGGSRSSLERSFELTNLSRLGTLPGNRTVDFSFQGLDLLVMLLLSNSATDAAPKSVIAYSISMRNSIR